MMDNKLGGSVMNTKTAEKKLFELNREKENFETRIRDIDEKIINLVGMGLGVESLEKEKLKKELILSDLRVCIYKLSQALKLTNKILNEVEAHHLEIKGGVIKSRIKQFKIKMS